MKVNGNKVRRLFAAVMCAVLGGDRNSTARVEVPQPDVMRRSVRPGQTRYSGTMTYAPPDRKLIGAALLAGLFAGFVAQPQAAQQPMGVSTSAGTIIYISNNTPPTFDSTGYTSSNMVWLPIGEIVDGGEHGRKYNAIQHKAMARRGVQKLKGSFDEGQKTLQLGIDRDDTGQAMAKIARDSDNDYYFQVAYPTGDKDFFAAKVLQFTSKTSGVDAIWDGTIVLDITTSSAGVGIVEVNAP